MPMVNMMKNEYRPVFSTTTPCSARYLVTIAAGMPVLANLPVTSSPGVTIVLLIGSSMLKPGAKSPKPCHFSLAVSIQSSRLPMPSVASLGGPQTWNHQSRPQSLSILRIARRNSIDSSMLSSTNAVPPGGSIIDAATSQLAMIAYCGEVDVCIRYASLNRCWSSRLVSLSATRICDACDNPASSLCVDCVENTIEVLVRGRSLPIACMPL